MEPTFLHIHRDDWRGECPRCLQEQTPVMLDFSAVVEQINENNPVWEKFQTYAREQAEHQMKLQEQMVRDELLRTYLLSPGGPGIVKTILYQLGSEVGERLYLEIQEEAKKYVVEENEVHSHNAPVSRSTNSRDNDRGSYRAGE